jgi:hypothetical protein
MVPWIVLSLVSVIGTLIHFQVNHLAATDPNHKLVHQLAAQQYILHALCTHDASLRVIKPGLLIRSVILLAMPLLGLLLSLLLLPARGLLIITPVSSSL